MNGSVPEPVDGPRRRAAAHRVVVVGTLDDAGLHLLRERGADLVRVPADDRSALTGVLPGVEALVLGEGARLDGELLAAAPQLRVVATAGEAADALDLEAATERGVLVLNAPSEHAVSAVEHTFALLLALARHLPQAHAWLRGDGAAVGDAGVGTEGAFTGRELRGKVLGVVGLGQVGQGVAVAARTFGLQVVVHDPLLSPEAAQRRNLERLGLEELLERSDFVSLHLGGAEADRGLLGERELGRMRPGALLVDLSRRGVVDPAALLAALESGPLGGAALDVVGSPRSEPPEGPEVEALLRHPRVVATPGLGGRTVEARERTSRELAKGVMEALEGGLVAGAVNLPFPPAEPDGLPFLHLPFLHLGEKLGRLAAALLGGPVRSLTVTLEDLEQDLHRPVALAAARGVLARVLGERVTWVNVEQHAERRGLERITRERRGGGESPRLVEVTLAGEDSELTVAGTVFEDGEPRVMQLGRLPLEFRPYGRLLVLRTDDVPGVVGRVGTTLGEAGVNIAEVHLARRDGETEAWTVLRLDEPPGADVLSRLGELPEMRVARTVDLGPRPPAAPR